MAELLNLQPPAAALINGIRSIGYSFSTAVADIIDNSISAHSTIVKIYFDPQDDKPYFCICDDGIGMNNKELINGLTFGSDRTDKLDNELELGRFGLGLKSASLSQCRELIVVSKKYGKINGVSYDLDNIEKTNLWQLLLLSEQEISVLPHISFLNDVETGTIVLWRNFDRFEANAKNFEETFRMAVDESKRHIELVFHRFFDDLAISYNGKRIEKRDPFLNDSPKKQTGRISKIQIDNSGEIVVTPHTLPFANSLTESEKALLGNPKSLYEEQGFYLYRNKRLIVWGNWLRMNIRSELNKLARIQIDFPSTLDYVWMLDVKKSSARIPDKIRDNLKASIDDSVVRSKKVNQFPGVKERSKDCPIWTRTDLREGNIVYKINRDNPFISILNERIGVKEQNLLSNLIEQIEIYIPKFSMQNDIHDSNVIVNSGEDVDEEHLISSVIEIVSMEKYENRAKTLTRVLDLEAFEKVRGKRDIINRRIQLHE